MSNTIIVHEPDSIRARYITVAGGQQASAEDLAKEGLRRAQENGYGIVAGTKITVYRREVHTTLAPADGEFTLESLRGGVSTLIAA